MTHPDTGHQGLFIPHDGVDYLQQLTDEKPKKPQPLQYSDLRAILFFPGLTRILRDDDYTRVDFRVLLAIILTSGHDDPDWHLDIPKIQRLTGTPDTTVHRSIRKFVNNGLLHRTGRSRLAFDWSFAWRNGATSRELAKRRARKGNPT
jgi:hypothetical protein